ncbi:MAG TPA: four helix bundle protein [Thermoanaerobaculia bacterium]|nr:four helix bundle protein [Thermoanaerobaculia bacterium]
MSFRNLRAWQESVDLAVLIYMVSDHFPPRERQGLTALMRRTAISLSSDIAEGRYARRAAGELDEQLEVAMQLGFLSRLSAATLAVKAAMIGKRLDRLKTHALSRMDAARTSPARQH